jgi:competence protein ComEC
VKGLDVTVLSAAGKPIARSGEPNQYCEGLAPAQEAAPGARGSEDPQSVAILVQFGKFRFANFGDGRGNRPLELLCPNNLIGKLDVLETPGHGGTPPLKAFAATAPRIAVADNGARKGGGLETLKGYQALPGLEDFWLLHFNIPGGETGNPPTQFIANLDEQNCPGNYLKLSAEANGSFTVFNSRTSSTKTYPARSGK